MLLLDLVFILASILVAYIPVLLYVGFVWWLDRYEREPLSIITVAFLWGAIGSAVISLTFELILDYPLYLFSNSEELTIAVSSLLTGPAIEEIAKALLLFVLVFYYSFDNITDGIVYGAIVGFGFSASENMLYYIQTYFSVGAVAWVWHLILRTMVTSLAHGAFTAVIGAGFGVAKTTKSRNIKILAVPLALVLAIFLHSLFNLSVLLTQYINFIFIFLNLSLVLMAVSLVLLTMFIALDRESDSIRRGLLPELREGFISGGEYRIVPHYVKRKNAARIIHKKYGEEKLSLLNRLFELETRLAFEKEHVSNSSFTEFEDIEGRIKEARDELTEIKKKLGPVINDLQKM